MPSLNKKSSPQNKLSQSKKPANGVQKTKGSEKGMAIKDAKESFFQKYNPFK